MFDTPDLTVACIVAHPDDEVLLAGASLARHAAVGHAVHVLIVATGLDSRGKADAAAHETLRNQARQAAPRLGAKEPVMLRLPDNALDSVPLLDIVQAIEAFLDETKAQVIYTHHRGDLNIDHRRVHDAVVTACRPLPGTPVARLLAGEVLSSTEWQSPEMAPFQPTVFHNVAGAPLAAKLEALSVYKGELRSPPHPRSPKGAQHLAALRGMQAGFDAAEAFVLVREQI